LEWNVHLAFEVVIPAKCLLFWGVGIDDHFRSDALVSFFVVVYLII
jgi:hypothetical protein